ncbi:DUF222 domain-containing protein [Paenarthrobacter sp. 2TAF44]|uniref:HNH endonuclease signature motif containing protein n=1 Tax=Paenarthrobacter sp. 2TAF44 TaxID=3233018 RepID=UPI003F990B9C
MASIGEIVARRAAMSGATLRPRRVPRASHTVPANELAAHESPTAVVTDSDNPRGIWLLRGIEPGPFSDPDGVEPKVGPDVESLSSGLSVSPGLDGSKGLEDLPGPSVSRGLDRTLALGDALAESAQALESLRSATVAGALAFGFTEAAGFAGRVEEIARTVEYLQVVAAHAVERTRTQAQQSRPSSVAGTGWQTGWTDPGTTGSDSAGAVAGSDAPEGSATAAGPGVVVSAVVVTAADAAAVADDGYRNAAEFLRASLRISKSEANRRLALAAEVLPRTGIAGQHIPPRREILAQALETTQIPTRSATIISSALENVRQLTDDDTLTRMEHALTVTAIESDPDFVTKMAKRWVDSIDQDGPEPSEEVLRQLQGAFFRRRRRHGLHHIEIFATAEQYETLTTAMNVATNPRLTTGDSNINGEGGGTNNATGEGDESGDGSGGGNNDTRNKPAGPDLDRRSRPMKLLDGLVGACAVAMTTGKLPANGGLRPQVTTTINVRDLFQQLNGAANTTTTGAAATTPPGTAATTPPGAATTGAGAQHSRISSGTATFVGPMHPNTIRKIACDADILPVLLGSDSRVLDIGRTTRIFPPHIRKAITARDGGCAFPDCTMPAPWCEAHHITYWSHGGTTSTENGTLLCSHHHHVIHKEQWRIDMTTGVPWFTPPPHIDPHQTPRRNHHHTPLRT